LLSLLTSACSDNQEQSASTSDGDEKNQQSQGKPVGVMTLESQDISMSEVLPGRVEAYTTAEIRPQVSGIVQALFFQQGSLVEKGEQLYQIDPSQYEAQFERTKASLQNARAELKVAQALLSRYKSLTETNAISEQELDNAQASAAEAEAAVALAQAEQKSALINLEYTKVYSPISGYIGPSAVTQGALVTAQQSSALAIVRQLNPVYVDISQSATSAQKLRKRLLSPQLEHENKGEYKVSLLIGEDNRVYPETGRLFATDLAVDSNTGTIRLRTVFPNPDTLLLPGMFVRATIENISSQTSIVVPQKAVSIAPDGSKSVWLVDANNAATKQTIVTSST
jgi:membrane fusion protein (multidrug efflux system)